MTEFYEYTTEDWEAEAHGMNQDWFYDTAFELGIYSRIKELKKQGFHPDISRFVQYQIHALNKHNWRKKPKERCEHCQRGINYTVEFIKEQGKIQEYKIKWCWCEKTYVRELVIKQD